MGWRRGPFSPSFLLLQSQPYLSLSGTGSPPGRQVSYTMEPDDFLPLSLLLTRTLDSYLKVYSIFFVNVSPFCHNSTFFPSICKQRGSSCIVCRCLKHYCTWCVGWSSDGGYVGLQLNVVLLECDH